MNEEIASKIKQWDNYYNVYVPTFLGTCMYAAHRKVLSRVMSTIPRETSIIDIGCGRGSTLSSFREWGFKNSVGIDVSESGIKTCQSIGFVLNKDVFIMDGTHTDYPGKSFEIVFSEGTLEHYEDFTPFVKEWCRIAKDKIIIVQPNHFSLYSKIIQFGWKIFRKNSGGVKELTYRLEDFYNVFAKYDFKLESVNFTTFHENAVIVFKRCNN